MIHGLHEGGDVAVSALVPVVIGPVVRDGPLILFCEEALESFLCRRRWQADFDGKAERKMCEVLRWSWYL